MQTWWGGSVIVHLLKAQQKLKKKLIKPIFFSSCFLLPFLGKTEKMC